MTTGTGRVGMVAGACSVDGGATPSGPPASFLPQWGANL